MQRVSVAAGVCLLWFVAGCAEAPTGPQEPVAGPVFSLGAAAVVSAVDLGLPGQASNALAASESGWVVGWFRDVAGTLSSDRAFVWHAGAHVVIPPLAPADPQVVPWDVNNHGSVVGSSGAKPFLWTSRGGTVQLAASGNAWAINDAGQVAIVALGRLQLWTRQGGLQDLGKPAAWTRVWRVGGLNERGHMVLEGRDANNALRAAYWSPRTQFVEIPGYGGWRMLAEGINERDVVVGLGTADPTSLELDQGYTWTRAGGRVELAPLMGVTRAWAHGIANSGSIVGVVPNEGGFNRYANGTLVRLTGPNGNGFAWPEDVNDAGVAVGNYVDGNGHSRAAIWRVRGK